MPRTPAEWFKETFKRDEVKSERSNEGVRLPKSAEPPSKSLGQKCVDPIIYKQPAKLREYKREYQKELRLQARSYRDHQQPCQQALRKIEMLMKTQTGYDRNVMAQRSMLELLRMEDQIQALIHGVDILDRTIETPTTTATFEFVEGEPVEYTADQIKSIISRAGQTVYIMLHHLVKQDMLELPEGFDFNGPVELIDKTRDLFKNINASELQV
jgi:hypothetical protein